MPPLPNPNARRPNSQRTSSGGSAPVQALPSGGRSGPPPGWPLGRMVKGEKARWRYLWSLPQAAVWEREQLTHVVARYCRLVIRSEAPDAQAALLAQTLGLEDRLGLSSKSMRQLRWAVTEDEVAEKREDKPARRLRVVDPKLAAGG